MVVVVWTGLCLGLVIAAQVGPIWLLCARSVLRGRLVIGLAIGAGAAAVGSTLFVPCTDGVRQVKAGPGERLELGWRAPSQVSGSPVVGGRTVYSVDAQGGTLYALDAGNGAVRASAPVGQTSRFATPTLAGSMALVGTLSGVTAVTTRP